MVFALAYILLTAMFITCGNARPGTERAPRHFFLPLAVSALLTLSHRSSPAIGAEMIYSKQLCCWRCPRGYDIARGSRSGLVLTSISSSRPRPSTWHHPVRAAHSTTSGSSAGHALAYMTTRGRHADPVGRRVARHLRTRARVWPAFITALVVALVLTFHANAGLALRGRGLRWSEGLR